MAYIGKEIYNPKNGQRIKFIRTAKETDGALLEMETTYNPQSSEPVAHYHPFQNEDFTVVSGELTVRINGALKVLNPGDRLHIGKNEIHSMWNASLKETVVYWKVQPAMETEYFLETVTGLAFDGRTNQKGIPNILQLALTAGKYSNVFRLSKPPFALQQLLFWVLKPFAYGFGFRPMYKKYID